MARDSTYTNATKTSKTNLYTLNFLPTNFTKYSHIRTIRGKHNYMVMKCKNKNSNIQFKKMKTTTTQTLPHLRLHFSLSLEQMFHVRDTFTPSYVLFHPFMLNLLFASPIYLINTNVGPISYPYYTKFKNSIFLD